MHQSLMTPKNLSRLPFKKFGMHNSATKKLDIVLFESQVSNNKPTQHPKHEKKITTIKR